MKRIIENLTNKNEHYLFPFFWQHGESLEKIHEYIEKMQEQGIYNMCIESRPHPEFLEDGWWKTMDYIIEQAQKRNMKIWILDDAKFPTGYANGKVPEHLKKKYLACKRYDLVGPLKHAEINASMPAGMREVGMDKRHLKDEFYKAFLAENCLNSHDSFDEKTLIDVSDQYHEGIITLDLENKHYSLFVLYKTLCGKETATQDYLDPMDSRATQILIDEVYEKHYQRYYEHFGETIVGFFSDEPRFGNFKGTTASIGREDMPLPWNHLVEHCVTEINPVYLFYGQSKEANMTRYQYMNCVSQLYSDNFSCYIGKWCKEKGVDYTGHTIEDNNAHARLGYGAGHYFRGIAGQSIAGIDIIGGQVVPGMDYHHDAFSTGGSDGEFYHYTLGQLGASSAKLDSHKKGILMCEAFGAYGWVEGLKMMKWITDHMVSHGVNLIVPHAFDPTEFPDWDCPPHFYAHGNNPQYPYFHCWANYADRLCHLMSGGYHDTKVGVLYHGFAEWCGDYMLNQKVSKVLQQHQIGYDIISEDYILSALVQDDSYEVNGYQYQVLIIPYAQRLPQDLIDKIKAIANSVKVLFIDNYPEDFDSNICHVTPLEQLAITLDEYRDIYTSTKEDKLVCYKYKQDDGYIYMLTNESVGDTICTTLTIPTQDNLAIYDAYNNEVYDFDYLHKDNNIELDLVLEPYQSILLFNGKGQDKKSQKGELIQTISSASLAIKEYNQKDFEDVKEVSLNDYLGYQYPKLSGQLRYIFDIDFKDTQVIMIIWDVFEIVEVKINGCHLNTLIVPPYEFDLSSLLKEGKNHVEIIVTNNLSRQLRDAFSMYLPLEPLGILSPIQIYKKEEVK